MSKKQAIFSGRCVQAAVLTMMMVGGAAQAALVTIPAATLPNSPGVYTPGGYYTSDLGSVMVTTGGGNASNVSSPSGRNDDGYMSLNLGFNVTFFGTTYNSLFVNNNGNVSFGAGISAYVPTGPIGVSSPMISPFFSDVDTRGEGSGVVHYNLTADQLVVTWDRVGRYNQLDTPTDSFQLVLRSDDYAVAKGEGLIGFFYQAMGWSASNTNTVAAAGFGDGAGEGKVLAGSMEPDLHQLLQNKYTWFDANLQVVPDPDQVPEPALLSLIGLGVLGAGFASRRKLNA